MSEPFEAGGIRLSLVTAPPVYAPGGPVAFTPQIPAETTPEQLAEAEDEAARRGAVLAIVQVTVEETAQEALLRARGFAYASSWYAGPPSSGEAMPPQIRAATANDVPRILEIGEKKRYQYEGFSPVFWKIAPAPRETFTEYVTLQVESETNVALVYEDGDIIEGYVIAQCRNLADGYVDDFATADPLDGWPGAGRSLLAAAGQIARERGVTGFTIVSGHADAPKRAAIESLGFALVKNWLVKPLTPPVA